MKNKSESKLITAMYHSLIIQCTGTGYRLLPLIGIVTWKKDLILDLIFNLI